MLRLMPRPPRVVRQAARAALAVALVSLGLAAVGLKLWLETAGPFLEALPPHPFCREAAEALAADHVDEALELAEVGACAEVEAAAWERSDAARSAAARCLQGVWTGMAEDATGVTCAIVSDLVVFGDVRDLARQGVAWARGEAADPVLAALSGAGLALTFAPAAGAGTSLVKIARRTGTLTRGLADSVTTLVRARSWHAVGAVLGDAGRIARRLGPGGGSRALAYADSPSELRRLAAFVESAPHPMAALRLGGKRVVAIGDEVLYRVALDRGPRGLALAAERGGAVLLSRSPFVTFMAKSLYKHPEQIAAWALVFATWLLRWVTWPSTLLVALVTITAGLLLFPYPRWRRRSRHTVR
jgi:uncharacterized protein YjeT (DUF2065 family)